MKFFDNVEDAQKYAMKHTLLFGFSADDKGLAGTNEEIEDFMNTEKGINWFLGEKNIGKK